MLHFKIMNIETKSFAFFGMLKHDNKCIILKQEAFTATTANSY